ncbi:MAG: hypothetical protein PVG27_04855 [Chloroflexota bacterium]|jgi:hypothetical protein
MDKRGPLTSHQARSRALIGGVLGLALVAIAGTYLLVFDTGTESTIVFGLLLVVGVLFVVTALRYWWRTSR